MIVTLNLVKPALLGSILVSAALAGTTAAAGEPPGETVPAIDAPDPVYETVVQAARPPLSATAAEIEAERIVRAVPASGSDALRLVPGLRIVQHGAEGKGHQLFLRGFDAVHGSDVEVLVEGVPLNERLNVHGNGYVDLYGIIPEAVLAIRVAKGPFLPWQGAYATAGSVAFELGVPRELRPGIVRTEASHRGRLRGVIVAAPVGLPEETFIGAEAVYDAGFGPDREAKRGALLASYSLPLAGELELRTLLSGQAANWRSPGVLRFEDRDERGFYGTYDTGGRGASRRVLGLVSVGRSTAGTDFALTAFGAIRAFELRDDYTGYLLYPEPGDAKRQSQETRTIGARAEVESRFRAFPGTLLAAVGWQLDAGDEREEQIDGRGSPWQTNRDLGARVHGLHASAGLRWSPWRWLELLPSVRGDLFLYGAHDRVAGRTGELALGAISPRIAVALPVHRALTLFADYGRGFRPPEARSATALDPGVAEDEGLAQYRGGRPTIAIADAVEAGARLAPIAWLQIGAAGFATWLDREVAFDHVSNTNLELNGSRRCGAEADLRLSPAPWLSFAADATFVDARFERTGHRVPGTSAWTGGAAVELGGDRGPHGAAELAWVSTRFLAHGATASGYALLDLGAGWRLERFDVTVFVDNALAAKAMDGVYHYASWFDRDEARSSIPVIHYTAAAPLTARIVFTAFL